MNSPAERGVPCSRATLRKIATVEIGARCAKVYCDSRWREFRVKFYLRGIYQKGSDYHSDSRTDAIGTAALWAGETQPDSHESGTGI